jgi:hypothetical protein
VVAVSVATAMAFVAAVRERPDLAAGVEALGRDVEIAQLVALGAGAGFAFTAEELRTAHGHDWAMRWIRYGSAPA